MEKNQNQSGSFIPNKEGTRQTRRQSSLGLFMLISLIILGLSVVVFAGTYAYQYILERQITKECDDSGACGLRATVQNTRENLGIEEILRYSRLDKKMEVAENIINDHITLVALMDTLDAVTLHNVRFTSFNYNEEDGLILEGVTLSYADLAAQEKVLEENNLIRAAVFSNLGLDNNGNVTFRADVLPDRSKLTFISN